MKVTLNKSIFLPILLFILMPFFVSAKEGISYENIIKIVDDKKLYEEKDWLYLLHYEGSRSVVDKNSEFFLSSKGHKDPKLEMSETIRAFFDSSKKGDEHAICSFPARFEYITKNARLDKKLFPSPKCAGYEEFVEKAPLDTAAIVFASENNMVPSSIMGHIFVKISGETNGGLREHAFSYFATDFDESSPKVYLDVIFSSIDGIYALTPYSSKKENYIFYDQRVVWEIELNLNDEQKSYFHKHLWELKEKNVRYSFIFHNCGTASVNLFKIVYGGFNMNKVFETPIDYIKKLESDGNIKSVSLIPSPEYYLKMVRDNYDLIDIYKIRTKSGNLNDKQKYMANLLHNYHESMGMAQNDIYKDINKSELDIKEEVKTVLDTNPSSRIYTGYKNYNKDAVEIEFMPLYQNFYDVSAGYFDDFETKIANIRLVYDDKVYVDKIDVFTSRSIIDSSLSWGMFSKHIGFSFENALGVDGFNLKPVLEAGGGYAFSLFNEAVKPYVLPKLGYRYDHYNNFYVVPEAGLIIKPVEDIKVVLTYEKYFNSKKNNRGFNERFTANAAYRLPKNFSLNFKYNKYSGTSLKDDEEFNIGIGLNF
jgi:hypothetical protein